MPDEHESGERRRTPRRRTEDLADVNGVVGWRLGQLENNLDNLEIRMERLVTRAELEQRFKSRDAVLARDYVPRAESDRRRDWTLRLYGVALAAVALVEPFLLRK